METPDDTSDITNDVAGRTSPRPRPVAPFVALGVIAVVLALFLVLVAADPPGNDATAESPLIGKPAPAITSGTLDGTTFDLSRRRGSWVVLNFFNSTCVPCIREHPELVAFHDDQQALGARGAELYTVVFDDADAPVREFFGDNGGGWPIIRDPDGTIAVAFGMSQVPETWIIAPNGVVAARFIGEVTADGLTDTLTTLQGAGSQGAGADQ
jgi:cytochrome c biogenesis protein CcmG, thiol:disulfide interchange protein DsbE